MGVPQSCDGRKIIEDGINDCAPANSRGVFELFVSCRILHNIFGTQKKSKTDTVASVKIDLLEAEWSSK